MKSESWIQVLVLHWVCFLEVLLLLLSLINERGGREGVIRIHKMLYLYTYVHGEMKRTHSHHMLLLTRLKCTVHTRTLPRLYLLIFIVMNIPNNKYY